MENKTKNKLILFAENTLAIKKEFKWHDDFAKRLSALLYAQENRAINCNAITQCHALIKQNTGIFSIFRGNMVLCIATLLSLSDDQQGLFDKTQDVYKMLKDTKFHTSDYLAVAAFQIASQAHSTNLANVVSRTRKFYDSMKAQRRFHTGEDDYILAAMLGLSDIDITLGTDRIEQIYSRLKSKLRDKNSIQMLSQVLVLGGSCDDTVSRVLTLRDAFRAQKIKLDNFYTLPILGILALLPVEIETIVNETAEAQQILREQKGFGSWSASMQERLLYAMAIVAAEHTKDTNNAIVTATLATSITNIIIAQQVAIMVAASSASTAAAAAAASSASS